MKTSALRRKDLRNTVAKFSIPLLFFVMVHAHVYSQKSYVWLGASGNCIESISYNFNGQYSETGSFVFDGAVSSYFYSANAICSGSSYGYACSGTIPNPNAESYSATCNVSDWVVQEMYMSYCYEPVLPTVTATKTGLCEAETFNISIGGPYSWFDLWVTDETSVWKEIKHIDGLATTVTKAEMAGLFSTIYGKTFYFRAEVRGCAGNRYTERTLGVSYKAPAPNVSVVGQTPVVCHGGSTGTVSLQISNDLSIVNKFYINCTHTNPINNFTVPDVSTGTYQIQNLKAGSWSFEVVNNYDKDNYGVCATTVSRTVTEPDPVTVTFDAPKYNGYSVKCNGGTGEATALGNGGVGGYKDFDWGSGITTAKITAVAGTYTVYLKDANNCQASGSVVLNQPTPLVAGVAPTTNYNGYPVRCWNVANGGMSVSASGGVGGYTYVWSTGSTSSTISGLSAYVSYNVTVTDANSCSKPSSLTLTAPDSIRFTIDQLAGISCPGSATAILQATPVPSTIIGSAHYVWSTGATSQSVPGLNAGTYTVTVSDDQTCSKTKSIKLINPPAHTVSLAPTSNFNGARIRCNGDANGILAATVRDANNVVVTAQNYAWFKGAASLGSSASLTSLGSLDEGQYRVVITYGTGCTAENQILLSDPDPVITSISPTTNYNGQPISCHNLSNANLRATSSGGTGAYTFTWNTGATGSVLPGVGAGIYTVNVADVNGCPSTSNYTLNNPTPVVASIASVSNFSGYGVSCTGFTNGSITAEGSGGTGVYSYSWNNGKTTALNNNIGAGTYTVIVSDNNGCNNSIQQTITAPAALTLGISKKKDVSCFGGSDGYIKLLPGGGVGDFWYSKDNVNWQRSDTIKGLTQGPYTLRLRDGNGCTTNTASSITQPTQITISFTNVVGATCSQPTGTAQASVSGGTGAYKYEWRDASSNIIDTVQVLSNVGGGIYTVKVRDANQCIRTNNVSITSVDGAQSTYLATPTKCFDTPDGSAQITITSGTAPFTVTWPDGQSTLLGSNLRKDSYNVLIKDGNNCTVVKTVVVPGPNEMSLQVQDSTPPTCNGLCDGQLTLSASGGVGGYSYTWNNQTGASQSNLCADTYAVVLKDANGCILNEEVRLNQPDVISVAVDSYTIPTCKDGCNGSLQVLASGGNGNYSYSWASGGSTNALNSICPGEYAVLVTDQLGCDNELTVELPNAPDLPVDLGGGAMVCVGQSYSLHAGDTWNSIIWGSSTGLISTEPSITVNEPGSYWVEVLNELGCVGQDTFLLETSLDLMNASFLVTGEAFAEDTVVMIDVSWPLPELIEWEFPEAMEKVSDMGDVVLGKFAEPGLYAVTLTAHLGECLGEVTKTITILEAEEGDDGGRLGHNSYLKHFVLHPNPNGGAFTVEVELAEVGPATLSVWHSSGILMKTFHQQGSSVYEPFIDLNRLTPGTYILRLDHSKGKDYIRFVVY